MRRPRVLLDTHVVLWWLARSPRLTPAHKALLDAASAYQPLAVSNATLWEIALLAERGRIELERGTLQTLQALQKDKRTMMLGVTARIAAAAYSLPDTMHRDPVDRLLIGTAMTHGLQVATVDHRITQCGLVQTV